MNKKELIEKIAPLLCYKELTAEYIEQVLEKHLPDFNPYRIDEERMSKLYYDKFSHTWTDSVTKELVEKYNSTLSEGLKPLPKEMPGWFHGGVPMPILWDMICLNYGTPVSNLQPLPSVEELADIIAEYDTAYDSENSLLESFYKALAHHLHSKYGIQPREWWMDLKEGDKFMWEKEVQKFKTFRTYLEDEDGITYLSKICTPYTITAEDVIKKHNLTEEEVRLIREGKCT